MNSRANPRIDKEYLTMRQTAYRNDPTIHAYLNEKKKVFDKSSIRMVNGVFCADEASQKLLDKLDELIQNHIEAYYPETLLK